MVQTPGARQLTLGTYPLKVLRHPQCSKLKFIFLTSIPNVLVYDLFIGLQCLCLFQSQFDFAIYALQDYLQFVETIKYATLAPRGALKEGRVCFLQLFRNICFYLIKGFMQCLWNISLLHFLDGISYTATCVIDKNNLLPLVSCQHIVLCQGLWKYYAAQLMEQVRGRSAIKKWQSSHYDIT